MKPHRLGWISVVVVLALGACGGSSGPLVVSKGDATVDASDAPSAADVPAGPDVAAVDTTAPDGSAVEAGDPSAPTYCGRGNDVAGATPPAGFCLKRFALVTESRALTFAPNGDLFVAAPSKAAPGGALGGPGAIILLSDDDHDGVAEPHTFLASLGPAGPSLSDVHGLALGGGYLYFTTQSSVWRVAYAPGQRQGGTPEDLGLPATFGTGGRWTHGLARSTSGKLFASRGVYAQCGGSTPGGEISSVGADGALTTVASGFRNPMYMRCHATDDVCAAMELGEDLATGATEKMVVLRPGTTYGYPCCYTTGAPAFGVTMTCGDVAREEARFPLSDTPFGFDWEPGTWPAPFTNGIFVALHGSAYSSPPWTGAGIVYAAADPATHVPVQDWQPFLGGFGPGGTALERPADIAFSPDGRLFFADDTGGAVYWMAPVSLPAPAPTPTP